MTALATSLASGGALGARHLAGQQLGCALAVLGHDGAQLLAHLVERSHERLVIRAHAGLDGGVARHAVGQDGDHVVGGGVAVYAEHVEGIGRHGGERALERHGGDGCVGGQEAEHGGHVGRDHAAALGDAAQLAHFAAQGEAHGNLLGDGIGGHDGLSRARAAGGRILQRVGQLAEILFRTAPASWAGRSRPWRPRSRPRLSRRCIFPPARTCPRRFRRRWRYRCWRCRCCR